MNQCKDCAKWERTNIANGPAEQGMCCRGELHPRHRAQTWADASCPAFEARKDWAQKVAEDWYIVDFNELSAKSAEKLAKHIRAWQEKEGVNKP